MNVKIVKNAVRVYTDGACTRAGSGGWAFIGLVPGGPDVEMSGSEPENSTNNRMEIMGVLKALEHFNKANVHIISDSQYVVNALTEWVHKWQKNGWKTYDQKPVKNRELWERILDLMKLRKVTAEWVKGHAGDGYNERCDRLANAQSRGSDPVSDFKPTHVHKKTGNAYRLVRDQKVKLEKDWADAAIYEDADGLWIVRDKAEFNDGRFEKAKRGTRVTKPEPM